MKYVECRNRAGNVEEKFNFKEGGGEKRRSILMHVNIDMYMLKNVYVGIVNNICMVILAVVCVFICMEWMYYLHACWDLG